MAETVGVCDGVGEDDAMGAFVEGLGDVPEPFLSSCVPDVEGDLPPVIFDPLDFKIDPDCTQVVRLKSVLAVAHKQASLSDSAVAND